MHWQHHIDGTMMRIDLPDTLGRPTARLTSRSPWSHLIVPHEIGGRGSYEQFDDGRLIFEIAQWFPRLAAYTDYDGWQTRPFLGRGEFTLEFGEYDVAITVPDTYIVGATGTLTNPRDVLTDTQRQRLVSGDHVGHAGHDRDPRGVQRGRGT